MLPFLTTFSAIVAPQTADPHRQRFDRILVEMIREGKQNKKVRQNRYLAR
jgi:hypothetical protein